VKTTPNPKATKKSSGELCDVLVLLLFMPLPESLLCVGGADVVSDGAGVDDTEEKGVDVGDDDAESVVDIVVADAACLIRTAAPWTRASLMKAMLAAMERKRGRR